MIFVDSSAWFALFSRRDANHAAVVEVVRSLREPLVTTDYVVDETLTLLRARGETQRAIAFGRRVVEEQWVKVERIDDQDFLAAWGVFKTFTDKCWSFTDCTSRVIMERLGVNKALAIDDHFCQFGTVTIFP